MAGTQFPGGTAIATQLIAQAAHFLPPKASIYFSLYAVNTLVNLNIFQAYKDRSTESAEAI